MKLLLLLSLLHLPLLVCQSQSINAGSGGTNLRPTHPLGIFLTRAPTGYRNQPTRRPSLSGQVSSGNVWLPRVTAYYPLLLADREYLGQLPWHERSYHFDPERQPARQMQLVADGVLRLYTLALQLPLTTKSELSVRGRAYSLDRGRPPLSLLTADGFIEWFHSNVAGGEDPFGRRRYGLYNAGIDYTDRQGRQLSLREGRAGVAGFTTVYRYYPRTVKESNSRVYPNLGALLGINTSRANTGADVGAVAGAVWQNVVGPSTQITVGIDASAIRQQTVVLRPGVQLTDRKITYAAELMVAAQHTTPRGHLLFVSLSANVHSSYFRSEPQRYYVLEGKRVTSHWPYAITHLYKPLSGINLVGGYGGGRVRGTAYLRQDYFVDNAPDLQAGFGGQFVL